MTKLENVIKALEICATGTASCSKCPMNENCKGTSNAAMAAALELLKEQEAIEPVEMIDDFYPIGDPLRTIGWKCGKCMERVAGYDNYCPNCGHEVKWDG